MAQMIVDNIEDEISARLELRARQHGRSMEEEVREILRLAVCEFPNARTGLGTRIAQRFTTQGLSEPLPELHGEMVHTIDFGA